MTACRNGDLPFLKQSKDLGTEINYLLECKKKGDPFYRKSISLLHLACLNKDLQLVNFLLGRGASVDLKANVNPFDLDEAIFNMVSCLCCLPPFFLCCPQKDFPAHMRWRTRAGATYFPGFFTVTPLESIRDGEMRVRIESMDSNRRAPVINQQPTAVPPMH